MMEQLALPLIIAIGILCYIAIILVLPKSVTQGRSQHFRMAMQRLEEQQKRIKAARPSEKVDSLRSNMEDNALIRAFLVVPGAEHALSAVEQAGMIGKLDKLVFVGIIIFLALCLFLGGLGPLGIILAGIASYFVMCVYIKQRIKKRRQLFLNLLPDALEIIVRSIKSGYPINSAIGMVADSLPAEVGEEYLRIVHEASFGYSFAEAITRFAERMDEPDVSFFAVVVNIQQETGGNLSEVLTNLSRVIRQRQQLKLKIRALSAEGRITVWILVGIAASMIGIVQLMTPGHFEPLVGTSAGHTVIIAVGCAFFSAFLAIKKIINFKI